MSENKTFPFVIIDNSVLTIGVRVLVEGIDLSQFERNPVALYDHNDWHMPIGTWQNVRLENGQILGDFAPDYADNDPEVQRIIGKIKRGVIKMASAGLVDLVASDDPMLQIEGQKDITIIKSRLREVSIVSIGKNHNAMRLYDRDGVELQLADGNLNLSDRIEFQTPKTTSMDKELLTALSLSDKATEAQVLEAVKLTLSDKQKAEAKVVELQGKLDAKDAAEKEAKKAEALILTDTAIKDGRIDAKAKDSFLNAFDRDFTGTKTMLDGIAKPTSLREVIGKDKGTMELADKAWDELDKAGLLQDLKAKDVDTYKLKFKEKFGKEPTV